MTDGTTGFPVAPITEDEMGKVHDILRRAADAIVGMSQLKADVDHLSAQVRQLSDDCERLRKANAGLEESLYQSRNQRQQLEEQLASAHRESNDWQDKANKAESNFATLKGTHDDLVVSLDMTRKQRDDAELKVMELEDKLKAQGQMLDKIKAVHAEIVGAMQPPQPAANPAPPPSGPVVQQTTEASTPPAPEPQPTSTQPEDTQPAPEVNWDRPYHWDSFQGRYVND